MGRSLLYTDTEMDWGASQEKMVRVAEGLRSRGHQLHFLVPKDSVLESRVRDCDFDLIALPESPVFNSFLTVRKQLRCQNFDLVHNFSSAPSWTTLLAARLGKSRCLVSPYIWRLGKLQKWIAPIKHEVLSLPESLDFSRTISSFEKSDRFRKKLGLTSKQFVAGTVSVEGMSTLLLAASYLKAHQDLRWLVVGESCFYRKTIMQLGLQGRVLFTGALSDPLEAVEAMDVACFLGTVSRSTDRLALETASRAVPLLATRIPGYMEICKDHITGYTVEADAPDQVADRLLHLMDDRHGCRRLGKLARQRVLKKFTWDHSIERLEKAYTQILGSG